MDVPECNQLFKALLQWNSAASHGMVEADSTDYYCSASWVGGSSRYCRLLQCLIVWWKLMLQPVIVVHHGLVEAHASADYCKASWGCGSSGESGIMRCLMEW